MYLLVLPDSVVVHNKRPTRAGKGRRPPLQHDAQSLRLPGLQLRPNLKLGRGHRVQPGAGGNNGHECLKTSGVQVPSMWGLWHVRFFSVAAIEEWGR
ncbi:hypothetical protein Q5P01_025613 [Channa striata]|uniref:Uncharacterized protein n=1 Tax=Channa striata TaxID=64152 RepID=A0AA88IIV2_CHASR|nr:hypothetical protein Q5P01_025613 [Channa striata]